MRFLKFVAALAVAALVHFAGARLLPDFALAVDLFLLVVALEARHGSPVTGMFAGLAAGLLAGAAGALANSLPIVTLTASPNAIAPGALTVLKALASEHVFNRVQHRRSVRLDRDPVGFTQGGEIERRHDGGH